MNGKPLGYLLTWTLHGSWLHGDERGSVDRRDNRVGSSMLAPRERPANRNSLDRPTPKLTHDERVLVTECLIGIAKHRGWTVGAVEVRSNHVHVVVSGDAAPERMMQDFKAWGTRALRAHDPERWADRIWTRHGSTRYLWDESAMREAIRYVRVEQDRSGRHTSEPRA